MKRRVSTEPETPPTAEAADEGFSPELLAMTPRQRKNHMLHTLLRRYADAFRVYTYCGHSQCARARRCVDSRMACYEDHKEDWREVFFPHIREQLRKLDGTDLATPEDT